MYACDGQAPATQARASVGMARATERHARPGDLRDCGGLKGAAAAGRSDEQSIPHQTVREEPSRSNAITRNGTNAVHMRALY
jgi:hypothetical protein